jgi:hypothetical protein
MKGISKILTWIAGLTLPSLSGVLIYHSEEIVVPAIVFVMTLVGGILIGSQLKKP